MDTPSSSPNAEQKITGQPARTKKKLRRKRWLRRLCCRPVLLAALQVADVTIKVAVHAVKLWQAIQNLTR